MPFIFGLSIYSLMNNKSYIKLSHEEKAVLKRPRKTQKEYSAKSDRLKTKQDSNNKSKAEVGVKAIAVSDQIEMKE